MSMGMPVPMGKPLAWLSFCWQNIALAQPDADAGQLRCVSEHPHPSTTDPLPRLRKYVHTSVELSKGNQIYSKEIESVINHASVPPPSPEGKTCHFSSSATKVLLAEETSEHRLEAERQTTNICESDSSKKCLSITWGSWESKTNGCQWHDVTANLNVDFCSQTQKMSKSKRLGLILLASGTKTRKSWNQGKKLINSVFLGLILSTSEPKPESHQIRTPVLILSISGATARESYNPHGSNGKLHKIIYMRRQHKIKSGFVGLISSSFVLKARNAKQERKCT